MPRGGEVRNGAWTTVHVPSRMSHGLSFVRRLGDVFQHYRQGSLIYASYTVLALLGRCLGATRFQQQPYHIMA
jgi:hypothetical protein